MSDHDCQGAPTCGQGSCNGGSSNKRADHSGVTGQSGALAQQPVGVDSEQEQDIVGGIIVKALAKFQKHVMKESAVLVFFLTVTAVQKTSLVEKGAVTQIHSVRNL